MVKAKGTPRCVQRSRRSARSARPSRSTSSQRRIERLGLRGLQPAIEPGVGAHHLDAGALRARPCALHGDQGLILDDEQRACRGGELCRTRQRNTQIERRFRPRRSVRVRRARGRPAPARVLGRAPTELLQAGSSAVQAKPSRAKSRVTRPSNLCRPGCAPAGSVRSRAASARRPAGRPARARVSTKARRLAADLPRQTSTQPSGTDSGRPYVLRALVASSWMGGSASANGRLRLEG